MKRILFLFVSLFCCTLLSAQLVLVKGGKAKGRIVRAHGDAQTEAAATLLQTFTRIETDFLHQLGAWILLPKGGTYEVASEDDGKAAVELSDYVKMPWKPFGSFAFDEDRNGQVKFVPGKAEVAQPVTARYIKVHVNTLGLCPDWHYGVGYPAWFFMDEVSVY